MSVVELEPVIIEETLDFDDENMAHIWFENYRALCGSTHSHKCETNGQMNEHGFQMVFHGDDRCRGCGIPICPFCRLLMR